jgi:predicted DCC family thiol-disulfide oxidoreductase YuxK
VTPSPHATPRAQAPPGAVILFYDPGCGVCSWLALRAVRAAAPLAVRALPIDSPQAEPYLGALAAEARWASWHVVGEDGVLRSGGAAAPVLLEQLPHTRPLVLLLRASPPLTERLYCLGARTRSHWGRLVPRRSVARARRELAALLAHNFTPHNQSERGAPCQTSP